jgi:hypothetical protein
VFKTGSSYQLPPISRDSTIAAIGGFVLAAMLAIGTMIPRAYDAVSSESLFEWSDIDNYRTESWMAVPAIDSLLVELVARTRDKNAIKARFLIFAFLWMCLRFPSLG